VKVTVEIADALLLEARNMAAVSSYPTNASVAMARKA
jgi:hypothetical protein